MQNSASSYAPSTIVDVQCQNARNSTFAILFELKSRLNSRSIILISTFFVYTILGAVIFHVLEYPDHERRAERLTSRYDRKRYELSYRIERSWKKFGGVTGSRSEWFNETFDHFKWYENEMTTDIDGREPFWNFENSLFFTGASICTAGENWESLVDLHWHISHLLTLMWPVDTQWHTTEEVTHVTA